MNSWDYMAMILCGLEIIFKSPLYRNWFVNEQQIRRWLDSHFILRVNDVSVI